MEEWRGANEDWRKLMITDDCASGLHDYCNVCECECHNQRVQRLHDELVKAANEIARLRAEIRRYENMSVSEFAQLKPQ